MRIQFVLGMAAMYFLNSMSQDYQGKKEFIRNVNHYWVNTHWQMWAWLLAATFLISWAIEYQWKKETND